MSLMYDPTERCAHCGGRDGVEEYDITSGGQIIGRERLHPRCVAAWEQSHKTKRSNGATPPPPPSPKNDDINAFVQKHGADEGRRRFDAAKPAEPPREDPKPTGKQGTWRDNLIDPQKLCDEQFPEVKYVVPGIIPEGVTLVASRPKLGKSWLILQISTAIATGTVTLATSDQHVHGDALYLALEDNKRRLQRRLRKYFGTKREAQPKRLALFTKWRRLDQGGLEDLREWCQSVKKPTLIAIDTLKKVRKPKGRNQSDYDADYEACEGLMERVSRPVDHRCTPRSQDGCGRRIRHGEWHARPDRWGRYNRHPEAERERDDASR
jgi:hypothetical protein